MLEVQFFVFVRGMIEENRCYINLSFMNDIRYDCIITKKSSLKISYSGNIYIIGRVLL